MSKLLLDGMLMFLLKYSYAVGANSVGMHGQLALWFTLTTDYNTDLVSFGLYANGGGKKDHRWPTCIVTVVIISFLQPYSINSFVPEPEEFHRQTHTTKLKTNSNLLMQ